MLLGIIDVGTNSIHLLVGVLGLDGRFHPILKERDLTRLGDGGLARGELRPSAMRRAFGVLQRYQDLLERFRVEHVEAVATSAVREARNGKKFVARVRTRLKLPLRIISGREEARLIYLGIRQAHPFQSSALMVTIGGGSAQVMAGDGLHLRYAASVPLGGARLAERFIEHDPPKFEEVERLQREVRRRWAPVIRAVRHRRWFRAFGSSATISQLMEAAYWQRYDRRPNERQLSISRTALQRLVEWLADSTADERIQLHGLDPRREDLALPTAIALLVWMDGCRVPTLHYAPGSLREGLVVDYLLRHRQRHLRRLAGWPLERGNGQGAATALVPWRKHLIKRMKKKP